MSKKLLFLMAFVVLLPMAADTPAYAGVLFSSDWDTALGTSVNAVTDGGVYGHAATQEVGSGWVRIEVLEPDHPVLGGNNYIGVWLDNQKWGAVYEWDVWPTTAEDIYFRFYQRTYPQETAPDYINFSSGHFVQPFQVYPGDIATSTNTWFGINGGGPTEWQAYISSVAHGDKWGYPYNRPTLDGFENDKWYRIECHIHYFRALEEYRSEGQTRCPTHTFFRIYDENGNLVKDTNDWMLGDPQDSQPDYTLQEWYDMGRYFWFEGNANSWFMGNNGPASASGAGRVVDYAAAEVRDDTWPGPVGGGPQPPGQASNPSPADSATDVSVDADLSWTAGSGTTSHDVYFGTDSTPDSGEFQGNQTATTFEPGTMSNSTTYYWRIDEINAEGTTTGNLWSFTTQAVPSPPGQATNPSPADSATDVSINVDLSWTAGSGATSHDVYFGTSTPGTFQGNQTATTFEPGTMSNDTTYYWRIDEINVGGTTTGAVWSFTTEAAPQPPGQATNPSPADSAANVTIDADLSWTAGSGSTSSDVYFGTTSPGTFQGNQTTTTFDPGTMANNTTYYWRIDEINAVGTTTGTVWSFTTVASGGPVTEEFGDATNTDYPGTIEDTWCRSGFDDNYSSATRLNTYTWPADTVANTIIIKWDLTDIPTSATVTEATLYLYQTDSGGDSSYDVGVHKIVNVNPVISALTWNTYDGTNSWTGGADGGQGDTAAAEDTPSLNSTNNEYKTWTVTNMVADWVSAPSSNYGMLANSDDVASVDSFRYFASTEDSNTPFRPKLIVTYISGAQAGNPSPADSAADVSIDTDLSWKPGEYADTHDVYLGTDVNAVSDANQSSAEFMGNIDVNTYDPGTLAYNTTYYWAIDEVNDTTTWPGEVWSFTTEAQQPPAQASSPSPADSAVDVSITATLSWTAGVGADSHDVYFGTTSPGTFQGNQTATTFDPGTMANDTTYYWRIDEINAGGTTTGSVWSFTTIVAAPGQASSPSPADSAVDVDIDADLSWTAGAGSTSSDVYFGTDSTPDSGEFQGNQTETTFDPGTLANGATYYWRIDEVNAAATTTGVVWSFTTIVAVPGQASSPSPADTATDIAVSADLSWTAGTGSTSSDVYFGTTSPGAFQGNQTATTFDPGTMANDTTYYWRIDEINAGGTTTGAVWSFTTIAAAGDQLVGWWKLDESAGTNAADSSGKGYDGTLVGADWAPASGKFAGAVSFNNVDFADRVDVPITEMSASAGSLSLWGKFPGTRTGVRYFFGHTSTPATGYSDRIQLFMDNDDTQLDLGLGDNHYKHTDIMALSTDTWYHIVLTWDTGNYAVYVNAGEKATGTYSGLNTLGSVANIGNDGAVSPDDGAFYGLLDDVRVYNYALGPSEVNDLYAAGLAPPGQASNPSPADSAADVDIDADLSWTAGTDSTSSDVYFGTTSPGTFQGNQTATTFDPGTMSNDTTYYWRIDEINAQGTTTGNVWSFTTIVAAPGQASSPSPADSATGVSTTADLSWSAGSGATSHDVYFGTTSPGAFQGNQTATTFEPGTLSNDTTYYWRIDEVNAAGTTTGTVWNFTTIVAAPGQATNPSPANSATDVSVNADLSWTAGSDATSHDVYFGTSSPGTFQGNQTATTFDPGTLDYDTIYYWRIDEINSGGTTTGNVWSFTTEAAPQPPGQATNPTPADSATDVSVDADLNWTAGSGSTSSDVYFGTTSPGDFQGNQTATTFDPGTLSNDTTYYWRIDEVNAAGTTTGNVWSFATESAPSTLPWTDGFESGDLVTGGWTTSGNASASNKAEYTGTYGAQLKGTAWMEKAISTAGFTTIHVKYVRKTKGLDSGEYLYVEYHDGGQWNELEATQATSWSAQDKTCGSGADNNAGFKIRFRTNANRANEYAYVDDVEITGTAQ